MVEGSKGGPVARGMMNSVRSKHGTPTEMCIEQQVPLLFLPHRVTLCSLCHAGAESRALYMLDKSDTLTPSGRKK